MDDTTITELINAATRLVNERSDGKNFTVAAAAKTKSGKVLTSLNLYHFSGGPCAELALFARLASEGEYPTMIVSVGDNGRGVLASCGKCRQVIYDYFPDMQLVVPQDGVNTAFTVKELLPYAYNRN